MCSEEAILTMKRLWSVKSLLAVALLLVGPALMRAQEVAGLVGTVIDPSGAAVSDASVKLTNTNTGATSETQTNETGYYRFVRLAPGPGYELTISKEGFRKATFSDLYLAVATMRTQDVQLQVGVNTQTVEVKAEGSLSLNTTDATIGNSFDLQMVRDLPVAIRENPAALLGLQPGVITADDDPNGTREGSVTGSRADQGNITLDGIDVNDQATGQAFAVTAEAPIDSIQEFRAETANPLADTGRSSGGQIQLSTKSGTNQFHGGASEYHRNTATAANSFFNNASDIPRAKLIRNQFGANIGGPIKKDKLFFFFDYEGRRDAREDNVLRIVPLDHVRSGELAYINSNPGCDGLSRLNTTPNCISILPATGANSVTSLDPAGVGADAAWLGFVDGRYPQANDLTAGDGINTGGFRFNAPVGRDHNIYVARGDWEINSKHKLFARFNMIRFTDGDDANFAAPIQFPGDPITNEIVSKDYAYVVGETWTISSQKVNQLVYGESRSDLNFPANYAPSFPNVYAVSLGDAPFASISGQARIVPVPTLRDDFTWIKGNHQLGFGGTFKPISQRSTLVNDFNFVTVGLGGLNTTLSPGQRPADILQDPNLDPNGVATTEWDNAFPYSLGRFASVNSNFNYTKTGTALPNGSGSRRDYKYNEFELYAQDSWKIRKDLTITYGLRYVYFGVPYEKNGLEATQNVDFATLFNQRVANGAAGIATDSSEPFLSYDLAGKANDKPGFYSPNKNNFAPRLALAWNPSFRNGLLGSIFGERKTVVRAGANIVYDRVSGNAVNFVQDQLSYLFQNSANTLFGNTDPGVALATDPRFTGLNVLPVTNTPPTITRPITPYVDSTGFPFGTEEGQFNYAVDQHFKTPYAITYSLGLQRELPGGFQLQVDYVSRLGRRLFSQTDAAQAIDFRDNTSGQFLSTAFNSLSTQLRNGQFVVTPQPWFENVSGCAGIAGEPNCTQLIADFFGNLVLKGDLTDTLQALAGNGLLAPNIGLSGQFASNAYITNKSSSNYNGLLTSLHKRFSQGLQFDFNYTYSHSIDNLSSVVNTVVGGLICDATNLRSCRANSDFDATHFVTADGIYDLPFGRGRWIGRDSSGWVNAIIGNWQVSTVVTWHTGFAFSTNTGAFPVGYEFNSPGVQLNSAGLSAKVHSTPSGDIQYFADPNVALSDFRNPFGFESGTRNSLRTPSFTNFDLGFAKRIPLFGERYRLQFRADMFNAFNHVNFGTPNSNINSGQFGLITTTANGPREIQFSLRFDF
jgi:hypothetical protein